MSAIEAGTPVVVRAAAWAGVVAAVNGQHAIVDWNDGLTSSIYLHLLEVAGTPAEPSAGRFVRRTEVAALQITPTTTAGEIALFDRDYRVPGWMRALNGWLVKSNGTTDWVRAEDFALEFEPITEGENR